MTTSLPDHIANLTTNIGAVVIFSLFIISIISFILYKKYRWKFYYPNLDPYLMCGVLFIVVFHVVLYAWVYEMKEHPEAYKTLIDVRTQCIKIYGKDKEYRFYTVDKTIREALEDNKITAREYDNILDRYWRICNTLNTLENDIENKIEKDKDKLKEITTAN